MVRQVEQSSGVRKQETDASASNDNRVPAGRRRSRERTRHDQTREATSLSFAWVSIEALSYPPRRLAKHSDRQHRQLMASLAEFGFISPLVATAEREVIVGEKRLAAARDLGMKHAPVVYVHNLTPLQVRKYRIADNRLAELREWNPAALREELQEIVILDPEINIEAMGIEIPEFDVMIAPDDSQQAAADERAPSLPATAFSHEGDIWEVDGHLVGCGDARDESFVRRLMGDRKAAVVVADGPFNCRISGHVAGKGSTSYEEFVMASGEMSAPEFQQFQIDWLRQAVAVAAPGALLYVASDWRALPSALNAGIALGLEQFNFAVWEKAAGMGSFYRSAHELFPIWKKPGAPHRNNVMLGKNGRYRSNRWSYPSAAQFGQGREALHLHPTAKPVALIADILLDCTKRGDIVLDPFSGSGTTLIAAERTGRKARVIDLDPRYVDVALRRYQEKFGREARLLGTELTLADLAAGVPRPAPEAGSSDTLMITDETAAIRRRPRRRIAKPEA